jgi:hypothetical protein
MKHRFAKSTACFAIVVAGLLSPLLFAQTTYAEDTVDASAATGNCGTSFLGMRAWYDGLIADEATCELKQPVADETGSGGSGSTSISLSAFVWTIILNVVGDLFIVIGVAAVGYIVYGGILYIMGQGNPTYINAGKRTIQRAVIGVAVAAMAVAIVNTIKGILI